MMKQTLLAFGLTMLAVSAASAQDASEIAKAKSGQACADCNLFQADLTFTKIRNVSFSGARLRQSDMSLATMDGVNFSGANLSIANLYGARFTGASFKNANLDDATLVGGSFDGADFTGATMNKANLSGAEMAKSRGLTQDQLNSACGDAFTELPSGLNVPHCR